MIIYLPSKMTFNKKILLALLIFFILSAVDGVLTLQGLSLGLIEEANPGMQLLIAKSSVGFMAFKLSLPVIFGLLSWRIRNRSTRLVVYSLGLILVVYALVALLHVYWVIAG